MQSLKRVVPSMSYLTYQLSSPEPPCKRARSPEEDVAVAAAMLGTNAAATAAVEAEKIAATSSSPVPARSQEIDIQFAVGRLGIGYTGNRVTGLAPGGQAEAKGVSLGWAILAVNGSPMADDNAFISERIASLNSAGRAVAIRFSTLAGDIEQQAVAAADRVSRDMATGASDMAEGASAEADGGQPALPTSTSNTARENAKFSLVDSTDMLTAPLTEGPMAASTEGPMAVSAEGPTAAPTEEPTAVSKGQAMLVAAACPRADALCKCHAGHTLVPAKTETAGMRCDECALKVPKGTLLHGCAECDWDICVTCLTSKEAGDDRMDGNTPDRIAASEAESKEKRKEAPTEGEMSKDVPMDVLTEAPAEVPAEADSSARRAWAVPASSGATGSAGESAAVGVDGWSAVAPLAL